MAVGDLLLPVGTRLLHIGPHKTGTTALQSALHRCRAAIVEQGVHYVGAGRNPVRAVTAVTSRRSLRGDRAPSPKQWQRLVEEFRTAEAERVVLSSEFFADAREDADIGAILDDLGREQTHVVVTLRPLARILASQWQQYVQNGLRLTQQQWLEAMFADPPNHRPSPSFWRRHHHDRLVRRWADQVGVDNVTVVVVDDGERRGLLRTFEQLLGLTDGTLVPEPDRLNRSLTSAEAEVLRLHNIWFRAGRLPAESYHRLVRHGAVPELKVRTVGAEEGPVTTPRWAVERAREVGARAADAIAGSGVRVVGDLDALGAGSLPDLGAGEPPARVTPQLAARAVVGAIEASGDRPRRARAAPARGPYAENLTGRQLLRALAGRVRHRVSRRA